MDFDTESDPQREGPPREPGEPATTEFTYIDPVQSFVDTVRELIAHPTAFFAGMARQGDFANPLIFAVVCAVIAAAVGGLLGILGAAAGISGDSVREAVGVLAGSVLLTPVFFAVAVFVGAGILHLLVVLIVKPAGTGFEATFRVVAYSSVAQLVAWVPVLGPLVAAVASVVLGVVGVREIHQTTTGRAALVVLIPAAVAFLVAFLLLVLFGVLFGATLFFTFR